MAKRSGLGKGLSSLIPADVTTEGAVYRELDGSGLWLPWYRGSLAEDVLSATFSQTFAAHAQEEEEDE